MIKLDEMFRESFYKYYGDISPLLVVNQIKEDTNEHSYHIIQIAMSVARTCNTVSEAYTDTYARLYTIFMDKMPDDVADKLIFGAVFMTVYHIEGEGPLNDFFGTKFSVRDIEAEIARDLYGLGQDEQIEKVRKIETEHSYSIQLPNPESWDRYFFDACLSVGANSKCLSRKIGAVLTRKKRIISTGYNGPPNGIPTCDQRWLIDKKFAEKYGEKAKGKETKGVCPRRVIGFPSGGGLEICPAGHAERNALIQAARFGIETEGTVMYMSCGVPCSPCLVELINAGVEEIVCSGAIIYDETALYLLENSKIKVRLFDFLA